MATWCTVADVATFAGTTVTDDVVSQAGAQIDVATARPYDIVVDNLPNGSVCQITTADLYWLKLACAYQAAWLSVQPDVYQRSDIKQIGRGTGSLQLGSKALVMAPLASQALRRVSFLKTRSLHVRGPMELYPRFGRDDDFGFEFLGVVDQGP